ncbi:MAG: ribosome recycling factor, partial [Clostridia bacterium]|nr:ribosome recycling factor [Clostridia bacterium]
MEVIGLILDENKERLEKTVSVLKNEYVTIRAGRANPHVLDKVMVDYYGVPTPINQVGNMSVQEGRCL